MFWLPILTFLLGLPKLLGRFDLCKYVLNKIDERMLSHLSTSLKVTGFVIFQFSNSSIAVCWKSHFLFFFCQWNQSRLIPVFRVVYNVTCDERLFQNLEKHTNYFIKVFMHNNASLVPTLFLNSDYSLLIRILFTWIFFRGLFLKVHIFNTLAHQT